MGGKLISAKGKNSVHLGTIFHTLREIIFHAIREETEQNPKKNKAPEE